MAAQRFAETEIWEKLGSQGEGVFRAAMEACGSHPIYTTAWMKGRGSRLGTAKRDNKDVDLFQAGMAMANILNKRLKQNDEERSRSGYSE